METTNKNTNFFQNKLFLMLGILAFALIPPFTAPYIQHIFIQIAFYAFAATAWNLVCGYVGAVSLGHGLYIGLGAYISTLLLMEFGISPWIGMVIGAVITSVLGALISYPTFRLQGPYFTLTSIALLELVRIWANNNNKIFGLEFKGSQGLSLPMSSQPILAIDFGNVKLPYYFMILAFLAIILLITYLIDRSKLGYYIVAIRSDPNAAESLGIPLARYKMIAMAVSTFLIAFAGSFYAQYNRFINPDTMFGNEMSVKIALLALVGGQGTVFGPLFGAILMVPLTEWLSASFAGKLPGLHLFIYGVVMMLVVRFMPKGIHDLVMRFFRFVEGKIFGTGKAKAEKAKS